MSSITSPIRRPRLRFAPGVLRVWVFIAAVGATSALVWSFNLSGPPAPGSITLPWWGLAVAFYVAEAFVVHLHFRKQAHTLSQTELGLMLGLFFASPASLLFAQLIGGGLAWTLKRRQKPLKLAFNLAEQSLCSGVALIVFRTALHGGDSSGQAWGIALFAAAVAHTMGVLLVSAVIAVAEGTFVAPQLAKTLAISLIGAVSTACVGLLGVELIETQPYALLLVLPPTIACGLAFRGYMVQREQREHVEFLYESMRATQGAPEFGLAVSQLLVAARRLLRAEYAEMLLLTSTPGEPILRSVSSALEDWVMHPEPLTPVAQLALQETDRSARPLLLARRRETHTLDSLLASRGLPDAVVGALRGEERVFGVLIVGGRVGDVSTFDESDLTLFETFAGHASVLLENGRLEQSLAQLTELKEELKHQAYHDALTGLPNRVLFTERVATALANKPAAETSHAVLFLDLDRFKNVNDSWGHEAGDDLLVQVAQRLQRAIRPEDIAARLGGDEFAVLLENTDADGAEQAARRLIDALEAPFSLSGKEASVGASVGIALTGESAGTAADLLRNADIAMYVAKGDERKRFAAYEPALYSRLHRRQELALQLERAVVRGEIVVHYQPVYSLSDSSIVALEALCRWQHPEHGLLSPDEFLGLAEESGRILEIGASVVRQSLRFLADWKTAVPHSGGVALWVNLSPSELVNDDLVEELATELMRTGVDPARLTLEITESAAFRDEHGALRAMHRLGEVGVGLSLDDFGTGYSSLSRLAELPIDLLKVPKPFVDRLAAPNADTRFADSILQLASSLGLATVAEGIEHEVQATILRELGCQYGQGFYFSRPMPATEALQLMREGLVVGTERPAA
jgi:diguanylate cyclase (GGDEF)-like protein